MSSNTTIILPLSFTLGLVQLFLNDQFRWLVTYWIHLPFYFLICYPLLVVEFWLQCLTFGHKCKMWICFSVFLLNYCLFIVFFIPCVSYCSIEINLGRFTSISLFFFKWKTFTSWQFFLNNKKIKEWCF